MEHLILGLLLLSPMNGYELQQFIKQNLALICSPSAGSVQTALTKLQQEGKITAVDSADGKRRKKIFSITADGRTAFESWIAQPMQAEKAKKMELSRLFFLGLATPVQRVHAIRAYIQQIAQTKSVLCAIKQRFIDAQSAELPDGCDWQQVFRFQGYTIDYGIAAAEFEQNWYTNLLHELEEELSSFQLSGLYIYRTLPVASPYRTYQS